MKLRDRTLFHVCMKHTYRQQRDHTRNKSCHQHGDPQREAQTDVIRI